MHLFRRTRPKFGPAKPSTARRPRGRRAVRLAAVVMAWAVHAGALGGEHPRLVLTPAGVAQMRAELGQVPLFDATLARVRAEVDAEIARGIDTPVPRDFSGGYTHERHKRNFLLMPKAGALFQILGDATYAEYLRDMLLQYAALYADLPLHPKERSYARGKLFWQCLNDANWLLYASQGYDAIHDWLSEDDRARLENQLFRPFADFLSLGNPQFFNRIHNHSTWGSAAVGMIGLVLDDEALVQRALHGLPVSARADATRDDDGGFIREPGQGAGFLANLEQPFSPDGYYTEGPYYQRYAMYPFLMFAQGLGNARPDIGIFRHKDGVLLKAVDALLQLTDAEGEFFPLNDAQKGMSILNSALVTAVDVAYFAGSADASLLSVAQRQDEVALTDAGFAVARAIRDGKARPFARRSVNLRDGPEGKQGGVAVLRSADQRLALVFKYSAQGLSHGHYDKLSVSLYDGGHEVLQDYGMARFVNIEQKGGGNYLPQNTSWAKQTVAHNTLVRDRVSHFAGRYELGSRHHSELAYFDVSDPRVQVVSATEANAYPGTRMQRTLALIEDTRVDQPYVLDLFRVRSDTPASYDLPYWFVGQHLAASVDLKAYAPPGIAGEQAGYQHLYLEATATPDAGVARFQWLGEGRFYTLSTAARAGDQWSFVRLGAADPKFNLRRDAALIVERDVTVDSVFAAAIEAHGSYSPVSELTTGPKGVVTDIEVVLDQPDYVALRIAYRNGAGALFLQANDDVTKTRRHELALGDERYVWRGPFQFVELH